MPGLPADNEGRFYWLLDRIVRREGIGDVLADGTYWAAQQIGKGAEAYAHNNIKKHEQLPLKLGMLNPIYFLMYSPARRSTSPRSKGNSPRRRSRRGRSGRSSSRTGSRYPTSDSSRYFLDWEPRGEKSMPILPDRSDVLRDRRLAGEDALHRRRPRHVRRPVVVPAEAAVSHPQLPEIHLGRRRARYGRGRADPGGQADTGPWSGPSTSAEA